MTRGFIRTVLIVALAALVIGLSSGCVSNYVTVSARNSLTGFVSNVFTEAVRRSLFPGGD